MMNHLLTFSAIIFAFISCRREEPKETKAATTGVVEVDYTYFGDPITAEGAIDVNQLTTQLAGKDSVFVKVSGTIEEVCQKKGCWMNVNLGNEQSMKVRFKDYAFFVPKDAAGQTVIIEGFAYNDTVSVAEQRHYAEDAGKSKEEIANITKPEISISFEANGVIIKK